MSPGPFDQLLKLSDQSHLLVVVLILIFLGLKEALVMVAIVGLRAWVEVAECYHEQMARFAETKRRLSSLGRERRKRGSR
jgi:hypothetical protein